MTCSTVELNLNFGLGETIPFSQYILIAISVVNGADCKITSSPCKESDGNVLCLYNGWFGSYRLSNKKIKKFSPLPVLDNSVTKIYSVPRDFFNAIRSNQSHDFRIQFKKLVSKFPSGNLMKKIMKDIRESKHSQKHLTFLEDLTDENKTKKSCSYLEIDPQYKNLNSRFDYYESLIESYFRELKNICIWFYEHSTRLIPRDINDFLPTIIPLTEYKLHLLPYDVQAFLRTKDNTYYGCDTIALKYKDGKWCIQFECRQMNKPLPKAMIQDIYELGMNKLSNKKNKEERKDVVKILIKN